MLSFCVLWRPFWKWRSVEICRCPESIRDIIIYLHIKFWWYRTMFEFCGHFKNGDRIFIIGRHFQNGRHNTAQIQHCPISSKFHMWVDYDVPNLIPTFIIYPNNKCRWNRTMLNLFGSVAAILKMVTARNFHCKE
jgi:hypothetical protein